MRDPSFDIRGAVYKLLKDAGVNATPNIGIDAINPAVYISTIDNADNSAKLDCYGADNAILIEVIQDFENGLGNWYSVEDLSGDVTVLLTENKIDTLQNDTILFELVGTTSIPENLKNGALRLRKALRFRVLTYQI